MDKDMRNRKSISPLVETVEKLMVQSGKAFAAMPKEVRDKMMQEQRKSWARQDLD
jgi:uncharacterized protein YoaH (UPF0181 family)